MTPVVDTIVHLFEAPSADRPHVGPANHHRMTSLSPEELFVLMDASGVDKAIQVTSGTMGWDNRYSIESAAAHPDRIRVVARLDPMAPDMATRLAALYDDPHVVGVRLSFAEGEARDAFMGRDLDPFWDAAAAHGVPVEIFACGDGAHLEAVLPRFPRLRVMLDHIGVAAIDTIDPNRTSPWEQAPLRRWPDLFGLVPFENLTVRVSAIPEITGGDYPYPLAQDMLRELVDRFGAERLMWGSNYPPSSLFYPYDQAIRWIRDGCTFLSTRDRELILGGNAIRVMDITEWE